MLSESPSERPARPADALEGRHILADLLQRVAGGDRGALGTLYRATSAKLYGVCLRILKDNGESEDVLQEVYMVVWRRAGAFDASRGSPITWLAAIARNRAIDRLRSRKAAGDGVSAQSAEAVLAEAADPMPNADDLLERSDTYRRLWSCLETLDPRHAHAIRAAFHEGVTYESLAGQAGVPLGTMKGWVRRSLLRLRGCLDA